MDIAVWVYVVCVMFATKTARPGLSRHRHLERQGLEADHL